MSKGKKINSFVDLLKRPLYYRIWGLLTINPKMIQCQPGKKRYTYDQIHELSMISNPPMTSKEINQWFHIKPQTLNTYLKNLVNTGLIKKIQTGNAKQVVYRGLTLEEFLNLMLIHAPPLKFENLIKAIPISKSEFLKNFIINCDARVEKGKRNDTQVLPFYRKYSTEQQIKDKLTHTKKEINNVLKITDQGPATIKVFYGKGKFLEI